MRYLCQKVLTSDHVCAWVGGLERTKPSVYSEGRVIQFQRSEGASGLDMFIVPNAVSVLAFGGSVAVSQPYGMGV